MEILLVCNFLSPLLIFVTVYNNMASLGQKRGGRSHLMTGFDTHSYCVRCCDKGMGPDPCVEKPETVTVAFAVY